MLVLVDVRIHEVKRNSSEVDTPDNHKHIQAAYVQLNQNALFVTRTGGFNGGFVTLQEFIDVFLPAVRLNSLMEVPLRVNKTHTHERNTQIAGFFTVVAGENAESPRINRQGSVQAKFCREVRKRFFCQVGELPGKPF